MLKTRHISVLLRALIASVPLVCAIGCSSSELAVGAPTPEKCQVAIDSSLLAAPAAGTTGTLAVSTTPECAWDARTATSWIAITSAEHGQGAGTVTYRVAANGDPAVRDGTLSINSAQLAIKQEAAPCRFAVSPLASSVAVTGGRVEIRVDTLAGCAWGASSPVSWIHSGPGPTQAGSGILTLTVDPNSAAARTGSVLVAGETVIVQQAGVADPACVFQVAPLTTSAPAEGGTARITVTTTAGCRWEAASTAAWITVTTGQSGTGAGSVQLSIGANTGAARSAIVTIAGQSVTVSQAAAVSCSLTVAPLQVPIAAPGGTASVTVTGASGCAWTASEGAPWLTIVSGASGSGNGTVTLTATANAANTPRTETVTVAGRPVVVTQAAAVTVCTFSISPTTANISRGEANINVDVTTATACTWTARSNASWLSIAGGASGTGRGTVRVEADRLTGAPSERVGTVTIAGQTLRVTQEK